MSRTVVMPASTRCEPTFLEMEGDVAAAIAHYQRAAARTTNLPEQQYLTARAARLRADCAWP